MKISFLIFSSFFILTSLIGRSQSGQLDISFGQDGLISGEEFPTPVLHSGVFTTNDKIYSVLQAVNVGEPTTYVRAYLFDGSIDTGFGTNGTLVIPGFAAYNAVYSQDQNKIYLGGQTSAGDDGFIDLEISTEAYALHIYPIESDYSDIMYFIKLTENNEVVLCGFHINISTDLGSLRVVKFNADMQPDNTFGTNGKVTLQALEGTNGSQYGIDDMEIDQNGNVFLLGRIGPDRKMMKILSNGETDNTFEQASEIAEYLSFNDLLITADSKFIVIPAISNTQQVIRLNENGSIDNSFANAGVFQVTSSNPDLLIYLRNGLLEEDGSLIVIGSFLSYTTSNFEGKTLIKLDENGQVDPLFPFISNDVGYTCGYNASFSTSHVTFQPDGKILSIDFTTCYDTETTMHQENIITRFKNEEASFVSEMGRSNVMVYPNPAENSIRLLRDGRSFRTAGLKIYDTLGNLVLDETTQGESIGIENLSPGFYSLHVSEKNNTTTIHFVKE